MLIFLGIRTTVKGEKKVIPQSSFPHRLLCIFMFTGDQFLAVVPNVLQLRGLSLTKKQVRRAIKLGMHYFGP